MEAAALSVPQSGTGSVLSEAGLRFMESTEGAPKSAADQSPTSKWRHPPSFYCPISQQCLHDPVVLSDGHTYERRHIERWLQEHSTSPVSNEELAQKAIFPNHALRNGINEYFEQVFSVHRGAIRKTMRRASGALPKDLDSDEPLLQTIDALMQCSFLMNADLSTEVVLRKIMDEAKALLGAEVASVFLVDVENQELYSNVNSTNGELRVPIAAGIAGHVATTGKPLIISDAYADKRFNKSNDIKTGFRTRNMMCVPLKTKKGRILGVVQLINKTTAGVFSRSQAHTLHMEDSNELESEAAAFTSHDLHFLEVFASQAATAVTNTGGVFHEPQMHTSSDDSERMRDGEEIDEHHNEPAKSQDAPCATVCKESSERLGVTCDATQKMLGKDLDVPEDVPEGSGSAEETVARSVRAGEQASSNAELQLPKKPPPSKLFQAKLVLHDAFKSWQFNAINLAQLTGNKPLASLGTYFVERLGLVQHLGLSDEKLKEFFTAIEHNYDAGNPYHNSTRAASVLHAMHAYLELGGIAKLTVEVVEDSATPVGKAGHLERMAGLLAAAVHDFDHLGVSNDFLVRTGDKRAMLYNDQHVNENHHVSSAFRVLCRPKCNFLAILTPSEWRHLRSLVIELVLSTDMAISGRILKSFSGAFGLGDKGEPASQDAPTSSKDAMLLLQMAIKCADLGHLALHWDVHRQWVGRLEEEFFAQGDQERARDIPISFLMDRSKPECSKTQTGFLQFVALPMFRSLVAVVPDSQPVLDTVMVNYKIWEELEANGKDESKEEGCVENCAAARTVSEESIDSADLAESHRNGSGADTPQSSSVGGASPLAGKKRSGRARQRAVKFWASVRRSTPSPESDLPRRFISPPP